MGSFINPGTRSYTHISSLGATDSIKSDAEQPMYGRVIDVILDSTHPRYKDLGQSQALYGVFYQPVFARDVEDRPNEFNIRFAYCKQNALRQIPVRTEIVQLEVGPAGAKIQERKDDGFVNNIAQEKIYWTSIVPIWNHPHLNIYPDVVRYNNGIEDVADLGENFQENEAVKPLQLSQGDVVLEGRHGQSLRFGGTKSKAGSLSDDKSNGYPYTILRNGQAETKGNVCTEDINADDASIYLTSNHKVPLVEANRKTSAAVKQPALSKDYQGKQIVINSDRVTLNAKENNITFSAKEHIGASGKTVSVDGEDYVGLDADKVYLGTHAQREYNPVLKGQEAVDLLNDAFNQILSFMKILSTAPGEPYSWVTVAKTQASVTLTSLKSILARIDSIKSKKVYTE